MLGLMEIKTMRETRAAAAIAARGVLSALIVEDEPHVRVYARLMLKALGVTTIWEAATGAEGLALYLQHQPSVVLMDVNMPIMQGDVMMARLTAIDPDAAVIVMTSESKAGIVHYFQELGAIGYVLKQLPREKAMAQIAEALDTLLDIDEDAAV